MWYVYEHISPSNKVYVGITSNIKIRWSGKGYRYTTYNSIFRRAILKYGWDNFKHIVILSSVSKAEACYAERYLIRWYKIHNISYNITDGGEGTSGRKCSEETKKKMRLNAHGFSKAAIVSRQNSQKVKDISRENIKKAQAAWRGSHHTKNTKDRIREKAIGRDMSKAAKASSEKSKKKVLMISPLGEHVILDSISSAALFLGSNPPNVSRAIRRNIKCKKYKVYYYV